MNRENEQIEFVSWEEVQEELLKEEEQVAEDEEDIDYSSEFNLPPTKELDFNE